MRKKSLLALLLAVALLLSGCALIQSDPDAAEVIRVGDTVYTKGQVQDQVDYQLSYMAYVYGLYGVEFDPADPEAIASAQESVVEYLIQDAVMNKKVKELALDTFTAEEQATLDARVAEAWTTNLESVKAAYFVGTELSGQELDDAIAAKAKEMGLSEDAVREGQAVILAQEKLYDYVTKDVALSEEELQASYELHVASDKETFAKTPSYYGVRINNQTAEVFYRPAGYRMVKQIYLAFKEADQALLTELQGKINQTQTAIATCEADLNALGVTDIDALLAKVTATLEQPAMAVSFTDPAAAQKKPVATIATVTDIAAAFDETVAEDTANAVKALAKEKAALTFYQHQMLNAKDNAYAALDADMDAIIAQLKDGADWDALMAEKTADPGMLEGAPTAAAGYAVCEDYTAFEDAFVENAMGLAQVGDVSDKVKLEGGYSLIQYAAEVAEGAIPLEEVREALSAADLATKQETVYTETLAQWVEEADAKVNYDVLNKE